MEKVNMVKKIEMVPVTDLEPYARNAKVHSDDQVDRVAKSIQRYGFNQPILISESNGIIAGHCRAMAAQVLGLKKVPVIFLGHLSEQERRAYIIADNKLGEFGASWDDGLLQMEVDELLINDENIDLGDLGFSVDEINGLLEDDEPGTGQPAQSGGAQGNEPPPALDPRSNDLPPAPPAVCQVGDLWEIGNHRLFCGDCRNPKNIKKLFGNRTADMLLTDPPYGVDYASKNEMLNKFDKGNRVKKEIENDNIEDYKKFFREFLNPIPLSDYNTCYIFMSGKQLHNLRLAFEAEGYYCADYLVWVKNNHVLSRKDYSPKHEFIMYGWKKHHKFYGSFTTSIQEFARPNKSDLHPTMKPVELLVKLMRDGCDYGATVTDLFAGSGSTLIGCQQSGRECLAMEIDPTYCDVIIKRWEDLTGEKARKL